ncbi:hypothetical protein R3P38DRAFT_3210162 [Favolaschia claudopus]|uniref:Uncharacterized protein n=1 Tax=Favolaschia claudopus TaxID=2862362 RepID=A0AAW0AHZ1_9AGAR
MSDAPARIPTAWRALELNILVVVFWPMVDGVRLEPKEVVHLIQEEKRFGSRLEDRALVCRIFVLADSVSAYCPSLGVDSLDIRDSPAYIGISQQPNSAPPSLFGPHHHVGYLCDHHEDMCQGSKVLLLLISDSDFADHVVGKKAYADTDRPEDEDPCGRMDSDSDSVGKTDILPDLSQVDNCDQEEFDGEDMEEEKDNAMDVDYVPDPHSIEAYKVCNVQSLNGIYPFSDNPKLLVLRLPHFIPKRSTFTAICF